MTNEEINKAIAEKVMEYVIEDIKKDGSLIVDTPDGFLFGFSPTSDIRHAWQVVEKMREKGYNIQLHNCDGGNWQVDFYDYTQDTVEGIAYEETVPLAICRAALKAIS